MHKLEISCCPGTLAEGYNTYSEACLKRMFNRKKVSHFLPYTSNQYGPDAEKIRESRTRISVSGVQEKISIVLDKNNLRVTEVGEQGQYILKPIPYDLERVSMVPTNEHLTMQIARQVYKIYTAENALIFFRDGAPAYLTKRFDLRSDGTKYGQEDFASLSKKTRETVGNDFKYSGGYEDIAKLIRQYVPAYRVELERFFRLILFNYLFSNGDAHLKNFSLLETVQGDYILSPAYDLICTRLHIKDTYFALKEGLFSQYEDGDSSLNTIGYPCSNDFVKFGYRIGIPAKRVEYILQEFRLDQTLTKQLIQQSFLDEESKELYFRFYSERLKALNYRFELSA
jgi:serine/threonine-protein kinase HipA